MKALFTSVAVAATLLTANAMAADLPARMPVKAPPVMAPPFSWTGAYIGANVGYSWGRQKTSVGLGPIGLEETQDVNGVVGGVQGGFNWQVGQWVFGMENDIQASGQEGDSFYPLGLGLAAPGGIGISAEHKLRWFGTARSRLGYTGFDNRVMIYATGGAAYGEVKSNYDIVFGGIPAASLDLKNTRFGWTAGGGIEWAASSNWSMKLEYLYLDLGKEEASIAILGAPIAGLESTFTDHIVRVGANYRFPIGGPAFGGF
ncbi:outer membrane protein [Rhodoplanes roseus]|nr:outer membrane protein [Rhodoplanes roseus]